MATRRKSTPQHTVRHSVANLKSIYRRWQSGRHRLSDTAWSRALRTSAYARALSASDQKRLRLLTTQILHVKSFEGALKFKVHESMRARIALHAAIPILERGLDDYADWSSFVIYPGDFRVHDEYMDEHGIVHREIMDLCGQSQLQGPIVLSWEAMREEDGTSADHDLVIHECAHKLDMLNGEANGFPPLPTDMDARAWTRDFHAAYRQLCLEVNTPGTRRIDPYAAEDPAEFFAVTSEAFFAAPDLVYGNYPAVYKHLQRFYRQDPASIMKQR